MRREFLESMVGLAAEGRTIIISSHQIAEVERIASHAAFIAQGRLLLAALAGRTETPHRSAQAKPRSPAARYCDAGHGPAAQRQRQAVAA